MFSTEKQREKGEKPRKRMVSCDGNTASIEVWKAGTVSLAATLIPKTATKTAPFYITRHEQVNKSEDELLYSLEEGIFLIGGVPHLFA